MSFSDLFLLYAFLPLCLLIYYSVKSIRTKNTVLLVASLIFYSSGGFGYLALLLLSAALNYFFALFIRQESKPKNAKFFTTCAVITNILMLAVFKYTDFFISNTNTLFSLTIPLTNIALPIGISFYTFKAISYIVDVYWEKVDPQKNYFNFLLYISMFPTIVAGPIIRYDSVENELTSRRTSFNDINDGIGRIIVGLAKKVIISNSLAAATSNFFTTTVSSASVLSVWMGAACFALQMYFDFSGYSDIAVGLGRLFGFNIMENFNYPFISKTVSEFWQRWHISLGTFFKDYLLYLPIFGKRRKYFSLFLVWFCTGFWHGASWNFIIWGLYFGVFMLFETLLGKKRIKQIPNFLKHIVTVLIFVIGFGIFKFTNITELGSFFAGLIGIGHSFISDSFVSTFKQYIFLIIGAIICSLPIVPMIKERIKNIRPLALSAQTATILINITLLVISTIFLHDATNNPFMYADF